MDSNSGSKGVVATVAVIIGLVVGAIGGGVIGSMVTHHNDDKTTASSAVMGSITPSAQTLTNNLVTLGLDHMTLTDQAIDAALDGSKDATASANQLYANGNTIGAAVGSVYGSSAQSTFDSVWKLHLDQFVNYAVADAKGDTTGTQTALAAINSGYTVPLAQFLAKANSNLPEGALQGLLSDHVAMTATIIDDHVQGNYAKEQTDLDAANTMMTKIFSTLANAIVKQYPNKFSN